ncbi:phosphate acetyltransferase [Oxobacter pfennigii]|uniref:Phosphate acetyltransferase n=1 Tax=Oxobacter pfennigii TaxID=36849 RepID=A0A0P8X5Y3_9CLOT|nr:phosphate butyryltransferase [Oxobacter pfennigii]KPU46322.1 phosphate acetyltransferase [Oxobacter pfennigii]
MIKSFDEILAAVKTNKTRRIAVAVAQDEPVLEAIRDAKISGVADAVLVGDKSLIEDISKNIGLETKDIEIIHEPDNTKASRMAVSLVSQKKADMVMKGLVDTATFLKAVLDKEIGLRTGKVLSNVAVFDIPALNRILILTDAGMNIAPDLMAKKQMIENAVYIAHKIGIELPKVAAICAVETVNLDMPATIDAAILSKMNDRGQIKGCIVDGPLAVDNAISEEAARHKGIHSPVAGHADILMAPNIETGNAVYKTLNYTTDSKVGSLVAGAAAPIILTSRSDSPETKLNSIILASVAASAAIK